MRRTIRRILLGVYNLILAFGAIYYGVKMIQGSGIFAEYPTEWLSKVPFEGWIAPGIIAIMVFGLGNIIAAIFSFWKVVGRPWLISIIMGGIFFVSLVLQVIILGEWYLATAQFFVFSIIQLCLSGYVLYGCRKNLT